ncbi:MAG: hypothetical protein D6729_19335 [Deltaproteobacteria bacterium]|nr:MAG: hypothetical protein D6729_19335 [Deltaproteobacteria bacterium]
MSALRLRLLTPRALDQLWREDVSRGKITVPLDGPEPPLPAEMEVEVELLSETQVTVRFQAREILEIPYGGRRVRGTILNRQEAEGSFLAAMGRCPLLGRSVLVASRGQRLGLELIPPLAVQGARVTVVHDGEQAFEVLAEGLLHMATAILEVELEGRQGPQVLADLKALGGEPDFPIFLIAPEGSDPADREAWAEALSVEAVFDGSESAEAALQRILSAVRAQEEGWHLL